MAKYWTASMQYSQMSVEELQKKAQESVKNAKNKGKEMHPIVVDGRQIAKSWWGMAWCKNIEQYADYASRIERGKRYVRSGAVVDLQIVKGKVKARVQGTRKTPYKVEINISPLKEEICEDIIEKCSSQIQNLQELVNGQFPESLKEIFLSENGLFPSQREISFNCSCPDWALMCKHVAAVLYGIGTKLDENPFLFFELRGIDVNKLVDVTIKDHVDSLLEHANMPPTDRVMDEFLFHLKRLIFIELDKVNLTFIYINCLIIIQKRLLDTVVPLNYSNVKTLVNPLEG